MFKTQCSQPSLLKKKLYQVWFKLKVFSNTTYLYLLLAQVSCTYYTCCYDYQTASILSWTLFGLSIQVSWSLSFWVKLQASRYSHEPGSVPFAFQLRQERKITGQLQHYSIICGGILDGSQLSVVSNKLSPHAQLTILFSDHFSTPQMHNKQNEKASNLFLFIRTLQHGSDGCCAQ